jgi:cellulose 1,4-beta-cellobiosidase
MAANGTRIAGVDAGATTPSYTQTGLNNGTIYYYVVTEVDSFGDETAASTQVSAAPSN